MERVILHVDANAFYASVESLYHPEYRDVPMAVCGSVDDRHGIVLAKNELAKATGIHTGEVIWQARQRCPNLVICQPTYERYVHFSRMLRAIYEQYTDRVEAFGLDENWLDLSRDGLTLADGYQIAEQIRNRVREELGITVSIGVSFNKVFAKLGSDYKKPDATTLFSQQNYREMVWPLPAGELLYVGRKTARKLADINVKTIGDLAQMDSAVLESKLGKNGMLLKMFAMGQDPATVQHMDAVSAAKSIGNSTTPPHDIATKEDAKCIFYLLAESVAARLRANGYRAGCLSIHVRTTTLEVQSCQCTLHPTSNLTGDLAQMAMSLFEAHFAGKLPLRSVGLHCAQLVEEDAPVQTDLLGEDQRRTQEYALEVALDGLRRRFGHEAVRRGVVLADKQFAQIHPRDEGGPQGVAFVMGNRAVEVLGADGY